MAGLLNDTLNSTPVLVILVLVIVWRLSAAFRRKSVLESLPVPSGAEFVWGHEKQVFMNEPGQAYRKWKSELGLTYRIKAAFGAPDILVLSDPVSIAYILQKKIYDYHHSRVVRPRVARLLGKGLGWVEGEAEHKRMRRLVRETLRLYPGLPYIERVATVPDSIPLGEPVKLSNGEVVSQIPVLPGQVVVIPCIAIHRMDSVWEDPDVFRPERWLKDLPASEKLCSGWANTLAFSDGPRNCVGYRLAIFQYKVILTYLLERFKFEDAGMDITLKIASSLQAWVKDRPELGGCLPVNVDLL
ncbi:cytochrome P450 [Dichomitus squalens]|uniref:Cytochrome P450 n=1 Tax=Dichomitus squalens TaxID=114155 RepID=A0A4Q9P9E0_9APHY|nr:cytochrome P450 [Dichomitus squalens]